MSDYDPADASIVDSLAGSEAATPAGGAAGSPSMGGAGLAGDAADASLAHDAAEASPSCPSWGIAGCSSCDHVIDLQGKGFDQHNGKTVVALARYSEYGDAGSVMADPAHGVVDNGGFLLCKVGVIGGGNHEGAFLGYYIDINGNLACEDEEQVHVHWTWGLVKVSPAAPGTPNTCAFFENDIADASAADGQ